MVFYTDGACRGNPGPGGWAFVALDGDEVREHRSGGAARTTNNIMEMTAALEALKCCASNGGSFHILYTDSDAYPLNERGAEARKNNADLYISIHNNSGASGKLNAVETYYYTPYSKKNTA